LTKLLIKKTKDFLLKKKKGLYSLSRCSCCRLYQNICLIQNKGFNINHIDVLC
jgi:hypothetical protein